jgi:glutaredoxin 3
MSLLVYSTPTCPWCHKVKNYLKEKNIAFEDIDVSLDEKRVDEMFKNLVKWACR